MNNQINMLPFLLEAFAENRNLYRDIDALYMQDKYKFYRLAKLSPFYNHSIICEGDILRQEYGRKALGILMACNDDPRLIEEVFKLLRKGWPYIYRLVEKEKGDTVDVFAVIRKAYKNQEDFLSLPDDVICSILTVILFLVTNFGKKISPEAEKFVAEFYSKRLAFYEKEAGERLHYKTITPDLKKKVDTLKKDVYDKVGVIKSFRDINPAKNEELNRLVEGFALLFDTEFISSPSLFDKLDFADKDIDEILAAYIVSQRNLSASEASRFLAAGIYIKYLLKAYKKAKEHYFKYNRETMFLELESREKENATLKQENAQLRQRIEEQQQQIEKLKKSLETEYSRAKNEFAERVKELEKENEQLKAELEADKNELAALRELAFSLRQESQPEKEKSPPLEEICQAVNSPAILIVGGHPNWQKQIKDKLPDVNIVPADMLSFDPGSLGAVKLVVFNTAYLNHGMYYKMINYARKNKIKVCYVPVQNPEMAIKHIWHSITEIQ